MTQPDTVAAAVARHSGQGAYVETHTSDLAVMRYGTPVSGGQRLLHVILAIFTAGVWIPIGMLMIWSQTMQLRRVVIQSGGERQYRWQWGKWREVTHPGGRRGVGPLRITWAVLWTVVTLFLLLGLAVQGQWSALGVLLIPILCWLVGEMLALQRARNTRAW